MIDSPATHAESSVKPLQPGNAVIGGDVFRATESMKPRSSVSSAGLDHFLDKTLLPAKGREEIGVKA